MRLHPYRDTVGKLTIGVGRNLDDVGISQDEANVLLQNDIAHVKQYLSSTWPWTDVLDDARRGVLLNMGFNLGLAGLSGFRQMLAKVQEGDFAGAAAEMRDSAWYTQVGARAERLAIQMETGVWT